MKCPEIYDKCLYFNAKMPLESRCIKDSSVGYCINENQVEKDFKVVLGRMKKMWKIFKEKNTVKGLNVLEEKINEFYTEIACKECVYTMTFLTTKRHIISILDYEICEHPHFCAPN